MALTGGVASGKSTVAELLVAFGARLVDFDLLAREALEPGGECFAAAAALFGPKSLTKDGRLDRAFIAKRIFKDARLREALEAEIHPYTWKRMLEELKGMEDAPFVAVDVPLLFETNLFGLFSPAALCFATAQTQLKRLRDRNPDLSGRQAKRVIRSQMHPAEKLRLAHAIVNNDGPMRETVRQTKALWDRLVSPAAKFPPRAAAPAIRPSGRPAPEASGSGTPGGPGAPSGESATPAVGQGGPADPGPAPGLEPAAPGRPRPETPAG
jgi:dephospho-CoA kinase